MRFSAKLAADRLLPGMLAARALPFARKIDEILNSTDDNMIARRMSLIAFAIRLISAAIAFVSQILLARWLGSFEYGIFVLVWTAAIIAGNLSCFGFATSIIRFVPQYRASGSHDELRGILLTGRIFTLLAATAVATFGIGATLILAGTIESYYVAPFILGAIALPMIALGDTLEGTARANAWPVKALSPTYIIRPLLILFFMVVALAAGFEHSARTAVIAAILATYATTIVQLLAVTASVDKILPNGPVQVNFGEWVAVSIPIFLVEGFLFLLTNADVLVVGHFLPPDQVAVYFATAKTLALVHFIYFAVKAGVSQRYAQLIHAGTRQELEDFVLSSARWTFWPSIVMGIIVLLIGKPLLSLFGEGFTAGYPMLFVLVAGVVMRASVGPAESLLNMSGNQSVCAMIYGVTLALAISLCMILIPMWGLWGAAASFSAGMVFEALALGVVVWKRLGIRASVMSGMFRNTRRAAS
ncbi:MAG: lipopolysaccharide biosynthesis protein [Rhizobiaceae bacterium]